MTDNWVRLAMDVTHYNGSLYLTMVDCGPSRFAIWRKLNAEEAKTVALIFDEVFRERGPVNEILLDNSLCFRSNSIKSVAEKWSIRLNFRCAYRPSGNGIVERNHRTIKRAAARSKADPLDMVYWYNIAPKDSSNEQSTPASSIFRYKWRFLDQRQCLEEINCDFKVGHEVFVKPPGARCSSEWQRGRITGINSQLSIDVNGIPRHIGDVRSVHKEEASVTALDGD